ncbi:hypothetical protein L208DRAFT_1376982 [Tricholoma matsutake]|nr:hypothetical protein L208DRAFT_1376982 [Tricholoma matsutake 945]
MAMKYSLVKETIKCVTGKGPVMVNHLLECDYCPDNIKKKVRALKDGKELDSDHELNPVDIASHMLSASGGHAGNVKKKKQASFTVVTAKAVTFSPTKQVEFENMLLQASISVGWSFNSLNDPEVCKLFAAFIPGAVIPDCRKLPTSILKCEVIKVEGSVKEAVKGHYVTLQADWWKDISKKHLLAFMVTANCESSEQKTGENIFKYIKKEIEYLCSLGVKVIGVAGDAGGDKYYQKGNPEVTKIMDECSEVAKWFNNHLYALEKFNEEQKDIYKGKVRALITPAVTRWTAHCCVLTHLLETYKALEVTSMKHGDEIIPTVSPKEKAKRKAQKILRCVWDDAWWDKVVIIKTHIEPLTITVNVTQALCNSNNLTVALLMGIIKQLYMRVFESPECPTDLMSQFYNYHTHEGVFLDEKWPISELKESLKEPIFNTFNQDGSNDLICVWKILDRQNPLISLTILILSFVPNSVMGDIKTKKQNRLGVQKLWACALVKDEDIVQAAERDAANGLRVSEDENDTDEASEDEGEGGSCSFAAIPHQFEKDAEADSGSDSDDEDTELGEGSLLNNQPSITTHWVGTSHCYINNLT